MQIGSWNFAQNSVNFLSTDLEHKKHRWRLLICVLAALKCDVSAFFDSSSAKSIWKNRLWFFFWMIIRIEAEEQNKFILLYWQDWKKQLVAIVLSSVSSNMFWPFDQSRQLNLKKPVYFKLKAFGLVIIQNHLWFLFCSTNIARKMNRTNQ